MSLTRNRVLSMWEINVYDRKHKKYSINKKIRKHESIYIDITKDNQLESFFNGKIGWAFIKLDNYFFDSYYISTLGNQIGGDHAFWIASIYLNKNASQLLTEEVFLIIWFFLIFFLRIS